MKENTQTEILTQEALFFLLELLDSLNMRYWVDGGWGVDILAGKQHREHRDLDKLLIYKKSKSSEAMSSAESLISR